MSDSLKDVRRSGTVRRPSSRQKSLPFGHYPLAEERELNKTQKLVQVISTCNLLLNQSLPCRLN